MRSPPALAEGRWMELALVLARAGSPAPNPHVGAIVVAEGRAVGAGHHDRAGGPHAEVVALRAAGASARGATIYVTLEPCNHYGRTPPCVDAILEAGIRKVVLGCVDPNTRVRGGGAERLRRAGIDVVSGVLGDAAIELIDPWRRVMLAAR